jgi:hypothetical protein
MTSIDGAVSRRSALSLIAAAAALPAAAQQAPPLPAGVHQAIKHYIIIELKPGVDQLELDRWYMTFHSKEVRRAFKAWQRNYVSFRSYLPPAEAVARYSVKYGRMTEIQFNDIADFRASRPNNIYGGALDSFTPPPGGWANPSYISTTATIPVNANNLWLSKATPPKQNPYLRWVIFHKPAAGVTLAQWDKWYKETLAPELAKLSGLKRFASYETVADQEYPRVSEFWFDDYAGWKAAFLPAPRLPVPAWGGQFPFSDTLSMFIGENPDVDFINDDRVIP